MNQDPSIGACQPKILSYQHRNQFEYAGAGGGFIDRWGYPFCRGRLFSTIEKDQGQYDDVRAIFWASGACFFVRASTFHDLGGFDEQFFVYYEEIDLCWRMQQKGFQIYYCGQSYVYHIGSATMDTTNPYKTYYNFRNRALARYKNMPTQPHWEQARYVILDLMAAIRELLLGRPKHAWAIVKAKLDSTKLKKHYQPPERLVKLKNIYKKSIVFAYFIKRKRIFSALDATNFTLLLGIIIL